MKPAPELPKPTARATPHAAPTTAPTASSGSAHRTPGITAEAEGRDSTVADLGIRAWAGVMNTLDFGSPAPVLAHWYGTDKAKYLTHEYSMFTRIKLAVALRRIALERRMTIRQLLASVRNLGKKSAMEIMIWLSSDSLAKAVLENLNFSLADTALSVSATYARHETISADLYQAAHKSLLSMKENVVRLEETIAELERICEGLKREAGL